MMSEVMFGNGPFTSSDLLCLSLAHIHISEHMIYYAVTSFLRVTVILVRLYHLYPLSPFVLK